LAFSLRLLLYRLPQVWTLIDLALDGRFYTEAPAVAPTLNIDLDESGVVNRLDAEIALGKLVENIDYTGSLESGSAVDQGI